MIIDGDDEIELNISAIMDDVGQALTGVWGCLSEEWEDDDFYPAEKGTDAQELSAEAEELQREVEKLRQEMAALQKELREIRQRQRR